MEGVAKRKEREMEEKDFFAHWTAYLTHVAGSYKKVGKEMKPLFPTFESFYKPGKENKQTEAQKQRQKEILRMQAEINNRRKEGTDGRII